MVYTPQQWHDDTTLPPYGPISADRLNYIEAGIAAAHTTADAAAPLASPVFTGDPHVPTAATTIGAPDNDSTIANTSWVNTRITQSVGTPISGTVTNAPVVWDGSAWVNEALPLQGLDAVGAVDDNVITARSGAYVQLPPNKNRLAKSRHATKEVIESIEATNATANISTVATEMYAALMPVSPGVVYKGLVVCTKSGTMAFGSAGTKHQWVALYSLDGATKYKQSVDDATTVIAANSCHPFDFNGTWTTPAGVYGVYAFYHCATGTTGNVQPTIATSPTGAGGCVGGLGLSATITTNANFRSSMDTITSSATAPSTASVTTQTGTLNSTTPYFALYTS